MKPSVPAPIHFLLNGKPVQASVAPGRLVLDYLRRDLRSVGTKEGCREGDCGACAVLLGELDPEEGGCITYRAVPSCMLLLGHVRHRHIVTIEGLNPAKGLSPVQQAVVDQGASQCGFCTPGFIVSFTEFVLNCTEFTVEGARRAIAGNLCRCTGYVSLVRAGEVLVKLFGDLPPPGEERLAALVGTGALPELFGTAGEQLRRLPPSPGHSDASTLTFGGGTDLIVQRGSALDQLAPNFMPSGRDQRALSMEGNRLRIPASASFEDLVRSAEFCALWPEAQRDLERFGSVLIRERATVGGNIANASPIADGTAIFLALDAELELEKGGTTRRLPLGEFFLGYKQIALDPGEVIVALHVQTPASAGRRMHFEKVSKREFLDIATVNSALSIAERGGRIEAVSLSAGGVAPTPLLLRKTAAALIGKQVQAQTVINACSVLDDEIAPISDVRGSHSYKRLLLRQLFFAHFLALFPELVDEELLLEVSR